MEGELADGDVPRRRLEAEVEDYLGRDAIDGAVEEPALDGEGEDREGEVGRAFEEDVGDEAVGASFPFCCRGKKRNAVSLFYRVRQQHQGTGYIWGKTYHRGRRRPDIQSRRRVVPPRGRRTKRTLLRSSLMPAARRSRRR